MNHFPFLNFFFAPHPMFEILKKWIEKDSFEFMHIFFEKEQIHDSCVEIEKKLVETWSIVSF